MELRRSAARRQRCRQVPISPLDQAANIRSQYPALGESPQRPSWRLKLDDIGHSGAAVLCLEEVFVMKASERPADLLIDETLRPIVGGDLSRKPPRNTKVPGLPSDLVA